MHYNNDINFIFLHMPKTGGTFIQSHLNNIPNTYDDVYNPHNEKKRPDCHFGINEALDYINKPIEHYEIFSTTRNPFDMYVSLYEFTKENNFHEWRLFNKEDNPDFSTWLNRIVTIKKDPSIIELFKSDHTSTSTWYKESILSNNVGWITYRWGKTCCRINKDTGRSEEMVTTYLKQESLNKDLISLFKNKIKTPSYIIKDIEKSKKINQTINRNPYQEYYTPDLIDLVNHYERFYLGKFNYTF